MEKGAGKATPSAAASAAGDCRNGCPAAAVPGASSRYVRALALGDTRALDDADFDRVREILREAVSGYAPEGEIVDWVHIHQHREP